MTLFRETIRRWLDRPSKPVRLVGGPMNGWDVTQSAPCLDAGWWYTMPETLHVAWPTYGRYVRDAGDSAHWVAA